MQEWREAWYLLRCRENAWRSTLENLNNVGLKTCCPLIHERRRRKDKKNTFRLIDYPAFPGYIFVHLNPLKIHTTAIKRIPGAMDFVHFGNKIATIHHKEIEALRNAEPKALTADSVSYECVNLPPELLTKIEEIYTTADPKHRVNLLISMLALPKRLWSEDAN